MSETKITPIEELTTQVTTIKVEDLFSEESARNLVDMARNAVALHVPDVTTAKGRKACISLASSVVSIKTTADGRGKDFVAKIKAQTSAIDASRKILRDGLDEVRDEARKPVTEWEAAEAEKKAVIDRLVEQIKTISETFADITAEQLCAKILDLEDLVIPESVGEEMADAIKAEIDKAHAALSVMHGTVMEREAEKAELDRLRQEEVERKEREEADRIERERLAREKKLQEEAAEAERKRNAQELIDAEERTKKAERDRIAAEEKAKLEKKQAAEQAEVDKNAAIDRTRREEAARVEREQKETERLAEEKRIKDEKTAQNKAHQGRVNTKAVADFMEHAGLTKEQATSAVTALAQRKISAATINY